MNKCPDREILERLVNGELDDGTMDDVINHLFQCRDCKEMVDRLITNEQRFLQSLKHSRVDMRKQNVPDREKCFSPPILLAYIMDSLSDEQSRRVESHLKSCDHCLARFRNMQRLHMIPRELDLDFSFLDTSEERSEAVPEKMLSIVLRAQEGILELIRQTGQLLAVPVPTHSVRGQRVKKEEEFTIRKDFADSDLSLEITFNKDFSKGLASMKVSAMILSKEEFVQGMEFVLLGSPKDDIRKTDGRGVVEFTKIQKGEYVIRNKMGDFVSFVIE